EVVCIDRSGTQSLRNGRLEGCDKLAYRVQANARFQRRRDPPTDSPLLGFPDPVATMQQSPVQGRLEYNECWHNPVEQRFFFIFFSYQLFIECDGYGRRPAKGSQLT